MKYFYKLFELFLSVSYHYVGSFITRFGESWEWEKSPGHSIWRQFVWGGTLEPDHALGLLVAVGHVVGVVAHVLLRRVRQPLVARSLISNTFGTLKLRNNQTRNNDWDKNQP